MERILGALLGAVAGIVIGMNVHGITLFPLDAGRLGPGGPLKWYALGGAVAGGVFGLSFARRLWSNAADDDDERDGPDWLGTIVVIVVVVVLLAVVIRHLGAG